MDPQCPQAKVGVAGASGEDCISWVSKLQRRPAGSLQKAHVGDTTWGSPLAAWLGGEEEPPSHPVSSCSGLDTLRMGRDCIYNVKWPQLLLAEA